eukprot:TRINITY_DN105725_c2_g1_i1.p1 TRINITY_DN105725_c2_g1~~TRINITY_DN105725_c2_g1_i1.p1  ORF type:complete len:1460 (-),score=75.94 TRINITY_DN105725_c2_g1_i1:591-4970(-)
MTVRLSSDITTVINGSFVFINYNIDQQMSIKALALPLLAIQIELLFIQLANAAVSTGIFPKGGYDVAYGIVPAAGGRYYIAGQASYLSSSTDYDVIIRKIDSAGQGMFDKIWGRELFDLAYALDAFTGGCIAVGYREDQDAPYVVKLQNAEQTDTEKTFPIVGKVAYGVKVLASNDYVIVGETGVSTAFIAKISQGLNVVWSGSISEVPVFKSVVETSDGKLAVIGNIGETECTYSLFDENGNHLNTILGIKYGTTNYCYSITLASDENFILAGYTSPGDFGGLDALIAKIDIDGNILWSKTVGGSGDEEARAAKETPNGGILFAGYTDSKGAGGKDAWIFRTYANGTFVSDKTYGGTGDDEFKSLYVASDGKFAAAGGYYSAGTDSDEYVVIGSSGCTAGSFLNGGSCEQCPPGQYQDLSEQNSCIVCDVGTHRTNPGGKKCSLCNAGSYQDFPGQPECNLCEPGTYQNETGKTACKPCEVGTFQNSPGMIACDQCHPFCKWCFGFSHKQCTECWDDIPNLGPVRSSACDCREGFYYDVNKTSPEEYCQPCHKFCKRCMVAPDICQECIDSDGMLLIDGKCTCSKPGYFIYLNTTTNEEECVRCHPLCLTCSGPLLNECYTCDSSKNAIKVATSTCGCASQYYYDEKEETCIPCNELCYECFGPGSDQCVGCNHPSAFSVEGEESLCVLHCGVLDGYYKDGHVCKSKLTQEHIIECHENCKSCVEFGSNKCLTCRLPSKVMFNGECIDACPSHYYPLEGVCYGISIVLHFILIECYDNCWECTKGGKENCLNCKVNLYFYKNQCFANCPNGTYPFSDVCLDCKSPCQTCTSASECLTCLPNFYRLQEGFTCVIASYCPPGTYPDKETRVCQDCHRSCLTCSGSKDNECLSCDATKGMGKSTDGPGKCYAATCGVGYFVKIVPETSKFECVNCMKSCKTCDGSDSCIDCAKGFVEVPSQVGNRVQCKKCSEINPGYYTSPEGKCKEICGDGINLGQYECDDGNIFDGDGCSSECKLEKGYKCVSQNGRPDICFDYIPPQAVLIVKKGNMLLVKFSEKVISTVDSGKLSASLKVRLEGTKDECNLEWYPAVNFTSGTKLDTLSINVTVDCHLRGKVEIYYLQFTDPNYIKDLGNNTLATPILSARAMRFIYVPETQQAAIEGAGDTFSASGFVTFGVVIGVNMLQSCALGAFWAFVNMLQIVSYIPIINCQLPYNLEVFLTQYLTVSKVVFPFKALPKWIPNPLHYVTAFLTDSLSERFSLCGYESLSFIFNFADQLATWLLLLGFYFLLQLLTCMISEKRCGFLHRWKREYEFNAVIRILIECYLNLVFCSFLNLWMVFQQVKAQQLGIGNTTELVSFISASIAAVVFKLTLKQYLSLGFMAISLWLVETPHKQITSRAFKEAYGTIIEEVKINSYSSRYYYPFYLARRLYYAVILIVLIDYPMLQLVLVPIFFVIPVS